MKIGIIGGKGKMGKVFSEFFKNLGYEVLISDLKTSLTPVKLAQKADVIIVTVPIDQTASVIKKFVHKLRPSQLVMDFTSVKEMPVKEMLKGKASVIGLHPMFNDSTFGSGQKVIVCPARPGKWLKWIEHTLGKEGGFILHKLTAKKHDQLMAIIQCLVHFAEFTFGKALQEVGMKVEDVLPFASPASSLKIEIAARLLSQDPNLYGNIQIENKYGQKFIKTLIKSSQELQGIIEKGDMNAFNKYFNKAAKFLGPYKEKAQKESDFIIMQWLEKFQKPPTAEQKKCSRAQVAVLGPKNSYTSLAAEKFNLKKDTYYAKTIDEIFELVDSKKAYAGIIPIENRLHGTIRETLDNLFQKNVQIRGEYIMEIHHCLATLNKGAKIETIYSHPQGFPQCSKFLKKHYKDIQLINTPSTAAAFEKVKKMHINDAAVIGPVRAAKAFGFHIVEKNIENDSRNETTFILITHKDSRIRSKKPKKTSIAFHFDKDSAGSLAGVLGDFSEAGINLTKLESRPAAHSFGDYIFFADLGCPLKKAEKALRKVKAKVARLKVLGEY